MPVSFDPRKVVLGVLAVVLIDGEWAILSRLAPGARAAAPILLDVDPGRVVGVPSLHGFTAALGRVAEPVQLLIGPLARLFSYDAGGAATGRAALDLVWAVVVMGVVGGAISRSAVVEIGSGERSTLARSLRFARRSIRPLIAAPLLPIAAAAFCLLGCAVIGMAYRAPVVGGAIATATLFIPLALGFAAALMLIDLAAALPLIHASTAADAESALDALTRGLGCVNRRLVPFIAAVAAAWLAGAAVLVAVDLLAGLTIHLTAWGLKFTSPPAITGGLVGSSAAGGAIAWGGPFLWGTVVRLLARGWIYGYYWSAASSIYLVLRRDVDGAPLSEIKDETTPML